MDTVTFLVFFLEFPKQMYESVTSETWTVAVPQIGARAMLQRDLGSWNMFIYKELDETWVTRIPDDSLQIPFDGDIEELTDKMSHVGAICDKLMDFAIANASAQERERWFFAINVETDMLSAMRYEVYKADATERLASFQEIWDAGFISLNLTGVLAED